MEFLFRAFTIYIFGASVAYGAQGLLTDARVVNILSGDPAYGGCMARVTPPPSSEMLLAGGGTGTLDCPAGDSFVAFNCDGLPNPNDGSVLNTKAQGNSVFNAVQLAMVTNARLDLVIDDSVKFGAFCYAKRADVFPAP